jgi:hypothetical protein
MVYIPVNLRKSILQLAQGHCEYCKSPEEITGAALEIDHIIPTAANGETILENLAAACRNCNGKKALFQVGIDPATNENVALFHPRKDGWFEHFSWSDDNLMISGLTPTGRATIKRLNMNNSLILIARRSWLKAGWQAPRP